VTSEQDKLWGDDRPRDNEDPETQTNEPIPRTQASQPGNDHSSAFAERETPRLNDLQEDHVSGGESGQGGIIPINATKGLPSSRSMPQSQAHSRRSEHPLCPATVLAPCMEFAQGSIVAGQDAIGCCKGMPELGSDGVPETVGQVGLVVLPNGTSMSTSAAFSGRVDDLPACRMGFAEDPSQHVPETLAVLGSSKVLEDDGVPETVSAEALLKDEQVPAANQEASTCAVQFTTEYSQAAEASNLMAPPLAYLGAACARGTVTLTASTVHTSAPPGQYHGEDLPKKLQTAQSNSQSYRMHGCPDDDAAQTENVLAVACCDHMDEKHLLDRPVSDPQADTKCQDSEEEECSFSEDEATQSSKGSSSDSDGAGSFLASPGASTLATGREMCHSTGFKMPSEVTTKGQRPPLSETALWRASVFRKAMGPSSSPLADSHCGDPSMSLTAVLAPPFEVAPQQDCHSVVNSTHGSWLSSSQNRVERSRAVRTEGSPGSGGSLAGSITSLRELPSLQRQRVLQDESRARFPSDNPSSQRTSAPSCSSRNTRGSARSRAVSEVPFRPQHRVKLPADSLRAHARHIVQSRLQELGEPPPPRPMGPPPMQGERTAAPLPPSYAMLGAKLPPPAVVRTTPSKAHAVGSGKEFAGRRCSESRMNSLSGIYGRLGHDHRPMLRVQSLPVLQVASRR